MTLRCNVCHGAVSGVHVDADGRPVCPPGADCPSVVVRAVGRLRPADVLSVRRRSRAGESDSVLAAGYGVDVATIRQAVTAHQRGNVDGNGEHNEGTEVHRGVQ